jgi:hypothetical protein
MPPDDWATRHPELAHWLQQAEDELVGYAPLDGPAGAFKQEGTVSRFLPFHPLY